MTIEDAKKELMVVHRNSQIGREYDHFYSVSSVDNVIEKLVNRINELERDMAKKDDATSSVEKDDTDAGICVTPNFRYEPTFEFYEDDIETISQLENGDFTCLTE